MEKDVKGSSFFFPSKGFFGGAQRRSANGYPHVRSQGKRKIVYTDAELQSAMREQSSGDVITLGDDIRITKTLIIREPFLTLDLGGRTITANGVMSTAVKITQSGDLDNNGAVTLGVTVRNGRFLGNTIYDNFEEIIHCDAVYVWDLRIQDISYGGTTRLIRHTNADSNASIQHSTMSSCKYTVVDNPYGSIGLADWQTANDRAIDGVNTFHLSVSNCDFGGTLARHGDIYLSGNMDTTTLVGCQFSDLTVGGSDGTAIRGCFVRGSISGVTDGVNGCSVGGNSS